jgi:hypothetical protein
MLKCGVVCGVEGESALISRTMMVRGKRAEEHCALRDRFVGGGVSMDGEWGYIAWMWCDVVYNCWIGRCKMNWLHRW